MEKNKKILLIGGIIEAAILLFSLVISILVWTTVHNPEALNVTVERAQEMNIEKMGPFIGGLQNNPTLFFCVVCIPVFLIVGLDLVYFAMVASKKETSLSDEQMAAIKKKAEEQVKAEMMAELLGETKPEQPEEK